MKRSKLKIILLFSAGVVTLLIIVAGAWLLQLDRQIQQRIESRWFLPPVEFYSAPESLFRGLSLTSAKLANKLEQLNYRQRDPSQVLREGDFTTWDRFQCQQHFSEELAEEISECLVFRSLEREYGPVRYSDLQLVAFDSNESIYAVYQGQPLTEVPRVELEPVLFAQFYGDKPILRKVTPIGQVPLYCLQAVTAIEDSQFLDHKGVSLTGVGRAMIRNLSEGRFAEGGSTITQQLIKNYFLTSEKTLKRKFVEMFMALILEIRVDKDEILENYLNVIYMGQNGPFQVRGFASASEHFFGRPIDELSLSQCAMLAAIINSPGRYNPYRHPENAESRRNLVLERMLDLGMISPEIEAEAKKTPLPTTPPESMSEPAPYFVQALNKKIDELSISRENGLRIFTTMDVEAQDLAQKLVPAEVKRLEQNYPSVKKYAEKGSPLQASLISVDLHTGQVVALVGGRGFGQTQYNRITESHRQVGSVMKPFVYMAALESTQENGEPYTPLTLLQDEPFTHSYEGQRWSPRNYSGKARGTVPLFYALKESINIPTAQLGLKVGLPSIIDISRRFGIQSKIQPLPSLTLGAYELYPWEVAQSYSTMARLGSYIPISYIQTVESLTGDVIFQEEQQAKQVAAAENVAVLVGMMKQTIESGTARSTRGWGFNYPAAGKTGTTSDTKDAWFAGFTPHILTIVWVGFDNNQPHGLTGASGAVPLWSQFMREYATRFPADDFNWPESVSRYHLSRDELSQMIGIPPNDLTDDTELILRAGDQPFDP